MQFFFVQRGGVMAVFRSKFQPGDAPPNDPLFLVSGPGHPLIGRSALPAHQQFRKCILGGVFAQLRFTGFLHHFPLTGTAGHLLLYPVKHFSGDDGRVIISYIALSPFSVVLFHPLTDAVGGEGLTQHGIPDVPLIGEDVADHLIRPSLDSLGSGDPICLQLLLDLGQAASIQVPPIDAPHRLCFLRVDLRLSIWPLPVTQQFLILEGHLTCLFTLLFAPDDIFAERLTFCLGETAEQGDEEFAGLGEGVDVLFFKDDPNAIGFQHPHCLQAVHCISCEAG